MITYIIKINNLKTVRKGVMECRDWAFYMDVHLFAYFYRRESSVISLSFKIFSIFCLFSISMDSVIRACVGGLSNLIILISSHFIFRFLLYASMDNAVINFPLAMFRLCSSGLWANVLLVTPMYEVSWCICMFSAGILYTPFSQPLLKGLSQEVKQCWSSAHSLLFLDYFPYHNELFQIFRNQQVFSLVC